MKKIATLMGVLLLAGIPVFAAEAVPAEPGAGPAAPAAAEALTLPGFPVGPVALANRCYTDYRVCLTYCDHSDFTCRDSCYDSYLACLNV